MGDPLSDAVEVLLGMAYEHRLRILVVLMDGDATPTTLAGSLGLDATLVAHHLRHLLVARLVRRRRDGRRVFYGIDGDRTRRLIAEVLRYAGVPNPDGSPAAVAGSTVEG
jgi:ArsR family transcriptional regulator, virulence genes transcriptional regulator